MLVTLKKQQNVLVTCKSVTSKDLFTIFKSNIFRIGKFQQQPELWKEIEKITIALRAESDTNDSEKQFLCEMFRHISSGKY